MLRKHNLVSLVLSSFSYLPAPANISFWWNWGSMISLILVMQMITGIFLTMHYVSDYNLAFMSVVHLHRDVSSSWLLRSIHCNSASLFMFSIYMHISRSLYYKSYLNFHVWSVGVVLLILSMLTAFLSYVLPWGQMSFWGATVITNFLSVFPKYGNDIVSWLWSSFSVGSPTLTRFYSFHFLFPFIIAVMSLVHLVFLHDKGSSNPLKINSDVLKFNFWPYSSVKDFISFFVVFVLFVLIVLFYPNVLSDPENFIKANPMVTPVHIKPEWYFLFAYAILRCIPNKGLGVIALVMSIMVLFFLPVITKLVSDEKYKLNSFSRQVLFWVFSVNFVILTWLSSSPVEEPFMFLAQISSVVYFFSLLFLAFL